MENKLIKLGRTIARKNNFIIDKLIYQAYSISQGDWRNVIFSGKYKNKTAVLKVYNEERVTEEPLSLKYYNQINTSKILFAPKLYAYKIFSATQGWLMMEKLPQNSFLKSPLNHQQRQEFLKLYLIYRKILPLKPIKLLNLVENLPAGDFHLYRMGKWLRIANDKQAEEKFEILKPKKIIPTYLKAQQLIAKVFKNRKMIFCHGHFKPKEIARVNGKFYLTDFTHMKSYPEGYELAFMIWADYLLPGNWHLNYGQWKKGVDNWLKDLSEIALELKIKNYDSLIRASLIERIMGAILADVASTSKPKLEKIKRISLLYNLFDDLT